MVATRATDVMAVQCYAVRAGRAIRGLLMKPLTLDDLTRKVEGTLRWVQEPAMDAQRRVFHDADCVRLTAG